MGFWIVLGIIAGVIILLGILSAAHDADPDAYNDHFKANVDLDFRRSQPFGPL